MKKVLVTAKDHSLMELLYHQIQLHSSITKFSKKKFVPKTLNIWGYILVSPNFQTLFWTKSLEYLGEASTYKNLNWLLKIWAKLVKYNWQQLKQSKIFSLKFIYQKSQFISLKRTTTRKTYYPPTNTHLQIQALFYNKLKCLKLLC